MAMDDKTPAREAQNQALWQAIFGEGHPLLYKYQRLHKRLPSPPRCKLCSAPFRGPGGVWMRLTQRGPSNRNPRYCSRCDAFIRAHPGGAEVELSMVFADVRGSTTLAERMSPTAYSHLMNRFYIDATRVFIETDGFMMDVIGDEVFALYPPGFSGPDHAKLAVEAAQALLRLGASGAGEGGLPFGTAVHTGLVYIGTINSAEEGIADVRAMGDNVNTAARLCSAAGAGEALISDAAWTAAHVDLRNLERRELERRELALKGKTAPLGARVLRA